jgi:hypothetical protein
MEPFLLGEDANVQVTVFATNEIGGGEHVQFTTTMPGKPDDFMDALYIDIGPNQATLVWAIGESDGGNPI